MKDIQTVNVLFGSHHKALSIISSIQFAVHAVSGSPCGRRLCQSARSKGVCGEDTASHPALIKAVDCLGALIKIQPGGRYTASSSLLLHCQRATAGAGQSEVEGVDLAREMSRQESHGESLRDEAQSCEKDGFDWRHGDQVIQYRLSGLWWLMSFL